MSEEIYRVSKAMSHVAVLTHDLERAERFYCGVLGLPLLTRHRDAEGKHRSTWVELDGRDGAFLAIERAAPETTRVESAPGLHCLALRIDAGDRARVRAWLTSHDVVIERESSFTIYVRDPDGTLLGLSHYPDARTDGGAASDDPAA